MGNKWQIPVYVIVIALAAFLIWNFVKPPSANGDNSADNVAKDKGEDRPAAEPKRSKPQPPQFAPGPGPFVSGKLPEPMKLDQPLRRNIVSGRVVETDGGAGVKDAKISFVGQGDIAPFRGVGYSGQDGTFRFLVYETSTSPANPTGKSQGRVHVASPDGRGIVTEFVDCDPTAPISLRDIVLRNQATISGQVLDPSGQPARGVCVNLRSNVGLNVLDTTRTPYLIRTTPVYTSAIADDSGKYEFRGLDPCAYRLSVEHCYYGMSPFVEVDAARGGAFWQDLKLRRENHVRGIVADPKGRPMPGVVVRLVFPLPASITGEGGTQPDSASDPMFAPDKPIDPNLPPEERKKAIDDRNKKRREEREKKAKEPGRQGFNKDKSKAEPSRPKPDKLPEPQAIKSITNEFGEYGFTDLDDQDYILQAMAGGNSTEALGVKINMPDYKLELAQSNLYQGAVIDSETGKPITRYDVRETGFGTAGAAGEVKPSPLDRISENSGLRFHAEGKFSIFNLDRKTRVRVCAPGYVMRSENVMDLKAGEERAQEFKLDPLCELTLNVRQAMQPEDAKGVALPLEPVIIYYQGGLAFLASTDDLGQVRLPAVMPGNYDIQVQRADGKLLSGRMIVPAKAKESLQVILKG
ncbi:MAG: carboxypeptidase regulatory-like domain-containing protein [Planctomycetes bacterium]|nr:carboxypeptidase regulatory-like domain-containing protein [Planctomycetota bacterium]